MVRKLADETGGGYYLLKATADLNTTFTRIAQELHSQYVLGFTPAVLDGKVHKLVVTAKRPGAKTRARKTYIAILDIIEPKPVKVADGHIPPVDPTVATYRRRLSSVVLS